MTDDSSGSAGGQCTAKTVAGAQLLVPPGKEKAYTYYRMVLLDDGFPGATAKGDPEAGPHPHPLYGSYLIRDSLIAYEKYGDVEWLEQAKRTGASALDRMRRVEDSLVFEYARDSPFNRLKRPFVSALTQARYLEAMLSLYRASGDPGWRRAGDAVVASFSIPVEEGGVAVVRDGGISFEELPHAVPIFILNGWLTVLQRLLGYAEETSSQIARDMFDSSLPLLLELLPRYDFPTLKNSSYRLAGWLPFALRLRGTAGNIHRARVVPPIGSSVDLDHAKVVRQWDICLVTDRETSRPVPIGRKPVEGQLVVTTESPKATRLDLVVSARAAGQVELLLPDVAYDPHRGTTFSEAKKVFTGHGLAPGKNRVLFALPPARFRLVATPTIWNKRWPEGNFNAYHFMHIAALKDLYRRTGNEELFKWARRWGRYVKEWPDVPEYQREDIRLHRRRRRTPQA